MRLIDAAEEVRKVARFYKAMDLVADTLTTMGSLEQASAEATARLKDVQSQVAEASIELEMAKANIVNAKLEAKGILDNAKSRAEVRLAKVEEEARKRIGESESMVAEAAAKVADYEARQEHLKNDIAAASQQLIDLDAKISKAKAQIAKLLGS